MLRRVKRARDVTLLSKAMKNGSSILLFVLLAGLKRGFSEVATFRGHPTPEISMDFKIPGRLTLRTVILGAED